MTSRADEKILKAEELAATPSKAGTTPEEVAKFYSNWTTYEEDIEMGKNLLGGGVAVKFFCKYVTDKSAAILDLGAGTGYIGTQLKEAGFENVDGLDPSDLLDIAQERKIYGKYYKIFFGWKMNSRQVLKDESYDHIITASALGPNHMHGDSVEEMHRVVRPGGYCVLVTRANHVKNAPNLKGILEPLIERLQAENKIELVERTIFPNYFCGYDGIVFVLRKK